MRIALPHKVSAPHHEGWASVRSVVPNRQAQQIMDDLYELGPRASLTTPLHACRL